MKTFKDLKFKKHPSTPMFDTQAKLDFNNKFGVSVVTGKSAYSSKNTPYEVAIMHNGELTYSTHITSNVIGYQTEEGVTVIMKKVQKLSKKFTH